MTDTYKYKAYISYSHRDSRWASWLHRSLESYRIPRKLVGTTTDTGELPSRIRPVFRDRDDMSSATDLAGTVKQALSDSENMIVVCSPSSVASHWVNEEIRQFARLGRKANIFCVIIDGDPGGAGIEADCFPSALKESGIQEPLAADVRRWADGKHLSKLKLVAGMLGLPLDRLRRRDLQKRQRNWIFAAIALAALVTILITAVSARIAAEQRRDSGESLVAYKLNELRTVLNVTDDPARLSRLKEWDQQELARLIDSAGDGENALSASALELREQGIALWRRSELSSAMLTFQNSWALLAEAYRRDRDNHLVFFELGQAEYWIGQVYRDLGALEAAEDSMTVYAEITRQLIVLQPENAEWVLEMAFALTNLGALQRVLDTGNPERALQLLQSALEYNQIALVLDPSNEYYQSELGQSHAFMADAQLDVCDIEGALQSRQKQLTLEQDILAGDPNNTRKMKRLSWALSGVAGVQVNRGDVDAAIEGYQRALQWMEPVLLENPDIRNIRSQILDRSYRLAMLKGQRGEVEHARGAMAELADQWQEFFQVEEKQDENIRVYVAFLLGQAKLAQADGDVDMASDLLGRAAEITIGLLEKLPGDRTAGNLLMQAAYQSWDMQQKLPSEEVLALLPTYEMHPGRTRACRDASLAARKAVMLGDIERAEELTAYLLDRGYTEMSFMRFCREHSLCKGR